jgi:hypothetical protein
MCLQCAYSETARIAASRFDPVFIGRDAGIRTRDPLTPSRLLPVFQAITIEFNSSLNTTGH